VLAEREKYQLLCANCNWIKKYEHGEHRWALTPDADDTQIPLFAESRST
jgi:hypothetical protein